MKNFWDDEITRYVGNGASPGETAADVLGICLLNGPVDRAYVLSAHPRDWLQVGLCTLRSVGAEMRPWRGRNSIYLYGPAVNAGGLYVFASADEARGMAHLRDANSEETILEVTW